MNQIDNKESRRNIKLSLKKKRIRKRIVYVPSSLNARLPMALDADCVTIMSSLVTRYTV